MCGKADTCYVEMSVNNTEKAKLYLFHPGDEILMVYDEYPYDKPEPIPINPENGYLWIKLKMTALTKSWRVENRYASKLSNFYINKNTPCDIFLFRTLDCFKQKLVEKINNTCKMPWTSHIKQWLEEFNVQGNFRSNCSNEEFLRSYSEYFGKSYVD